MVFLFPEFRIPAEESDVSTASQKEVRLTCAVMRFRGGIHCYGVVGESIMGRGHFELGLEGEVEG